jgi:threonine/homoserine/homoserine lactone efflux protein
VLTPDGGIVDACSNDGARPGAAMGDAIGQMLPAAVGVAVSPLPIVVVVLMLVSRRGRVNGPAFVLGWIAGLAIVGAIVLSLSSGADAADNGAPATWVGVLKLVLGALLLLVGLKQWRGRPHDPADVSTPKWMGALETFTPVKAAGAGALLAGLNPKNTLLTIGGAAAIAETGIATDEQVVAYALFVVIATLGVGAPVVIALVMGDRAAKLLEGLQRWMAANNAVIMAVLMLILGVKLIGDGISGL